jgi:Lar family restriction alleviation protein
MNEPKQCPFCGKSDKVIIYTESMARYGKLLWIRYGVKCKRCHFGIPTYAKKAAAIHKWNTRPTEDELTARNKELVETVKGLEKTIGRAEKVLGERNLLAAEVERLKAVMKDIKGHLEFLPKILKGRAGVANYVITAIDKALANKESEGEDE